MIHKLDTLEALFAAIEADKSDRSPAAVRYPVRLIFVQTFHALKELASHLAKRLSPVELKTALPHEDGWFTSDHLYQIVTSQAANSLIVPLSEVLRFFTDSELQAFLLSLFEIENAPEQASRRMYLPFVGLKGRCENNVFSAFHRRAHWAPIWSVEEGRAEKIQMYQLAAEMGSAANVTPADFTCIHTTSEWLDLWKRAPRHVVCQSRSMAHLSRDFLPDAIFQPEPIDTPKAYLEKIWGVALPIPYRANDAPFWDMLLRQKSEHASDAGWHDFHSIIAAYFNVQNFRTIALPGLVKLWFQYPESFSRWLLRHWILHQPHLQASYLCTVLAEIVDYSDDELIKRLWFDIFEINPANADLFAERKTYLKLLHEDYKLPSHPIEETLRHKLSGLREMPVERQARYLTNITHAERKDLFELLKTLGIDQQQRYDALLSDVYPDLKNYLESGVFTVAKTKGVSSAGLILLGNLPLSSSKQPLHPKYFSTLPTFFQSSALLDRFHGFLEGWKLKRVNEDLKVKGYTLNVEYFSEILHALRGAGDYAYTVSEMLDIPEKSAADTRDTSAIKKLAAGYLKLLFPHVKTPDDITSNEFCGYCLQPAIEKRGIMRKQISLIDSEFHEHLPEMTVRERL